MPEDRPHFLALDTQIVWKRTQELSENRLPEHAVSVGDPNLNSAVKPTLPIRSPHGRTFAVFHITAPITE